MVSTVALSSLLAQWEILLQKLIINYKGKQEVQCETV